MKKRVRFWLILLAVGLAGVVLTCAYMMGTGRMMSYEAGQAFSLDEGFETLKVEAVRAQVTVLPTDQKPYVDVYAKAWLPGPINLNDLLDWDLKDGVLTVREIPFEPHFLGLFPQPYEMTITAHVPQAVYERYMGEQP
jgi:hypothetical protein